MALKANANSRDLVGMCQNATFLKGAEIATSDMPNKICNPRQTRENFSKRQALENAPASSAGKFQQTSRARKRASVKRGKI